MNSQAKNNSHNPPSGTQSAPKAPILKKAREQKGLSLENVHETTKIPLDVLRAIEEGYRVKSVSPFYYKSFIKIYATFLEINPSEILEAMEEQKPAPKVSTPAPLPISEFNSSEWINRTFTRQRKKQIMTGLVLILGLFVVFKVFGWIHYKWTHRPVKTAVVKTQEPKKDKKPVKVDKKETAKPKEAVKEVKEAIKEEEKPFVEEVSQVVAAPVVQSPSTTTTITKNVTLTVRAKKSIWLSVKADGATVFQSTLGSGSVETWMANEKLEISGRNLSQLEFELNGKMIGTLGREDRQAKRIVFTKEGLSVSK